MDPQTPTSSQVNAQEQEPSKGGAGIHGAIGRAAERRMIWSGGRLAIRVGIAAGRAIFIWIIQTAAVWIAILLVSVSTFLIALFAGD